MTLLSPTHLLTWRLELIEDGGYSCWELQDRDGRRWGWVINAPAIGWAAHVGDFGQAATVGQPETPLVRAIEHRATAADGREWVEEEIARQWRLLTDGAPIGGSSRDRQG